MIRRTTPPASGASSRPDLASWLALGGALGFLALIAAIRLDDTALWADEAWSLAATNDLGMSLRSTHGTMAAYYLPLWLWAKIDDSAVWLRLLSTVFAAGTVTITQRIARRAGGRALGIVAPLALVTSPMFLFTATEARGYALETLLTAICWYATLRLCEQRTPRRERLRWQSVLAIAAGLGPLAHGLFVAQLTGIGAYAALTADRRRRMRLIAPALLVALVVTGALWQLGLSSAGSVFQLDAGQIVRSLRSWYLSPVAWIGTTIAALVAVAVIVAAARHGRGDAAAPERSVALDRLRLPLCWTLVPLAALVVVKVVHTIWAPYYLSPITPGVAMLVGAGVVSIGEAIAPARVRSGAIASLAVVVVIALGWSTLGRPLRPVEDWSGAAELVATQTLPGDGIVFSGGLSENPTESRAPFEAAWRDTHGRIVPDPVSPRRPLGEARRVDDYLSPAAVRKASLGYRRIWIVDYRGVIEAEGVTSHPPFDQAFRLIERRTFRGDISVSLYQRRVLRE